MGNTTLPISFFEADDASMTATISIHPLQGYTSTIGEQLKQKLVDFISNQEIGETVYLTQAIAALVGTTYNLQQIAWAVPSLSVEVSSDLEAGFAIAFTDLPSLQVSNVVLALV